MLREKKKGVWFDIVKQYRDVETRVLWSSCHPQGWDEQQDGTSLRRAVYSWHQSSSMAMRYEIMRLLLSIWIPGDEKGFKTEIFLKHRWRLLSVSKLGEWVELSDVLCWFWLGLPESKPRLPGPSAAHSCLGFGPAIFLVHHRYH